MTDRLTLSRTALRLGLTYHQVRALVLRGELRGGQDDHGRFYVERAAVDRYAARRTVRPVRRASGGR